MDRPWRRSWRLIGFRLARPRLTAALLALAALAAAPAATPPLRAMRWLAAGVDPAIALTRHPTECLGAATDPETRYEIELGRAAFRTPLLLGGQAARAGLSCESCHRSGRNNPDFEFPGISGAPGTADVGTSVLSSHRGGLPLSPVPIPDLSGPKSALKTAQDLASHALETRIDTIDTQEFDGHEPPPAVLKGLAAYVRQLSPAACPAAATEPVTATAALADVTRAVRAAFMALGHHDSASSALMIEAARSALGDIDERYAGEALAPERALLVRASADLGAAAAEGRVSPRAAARDLDLWLAREPAWAPALLKGEPLSLYNPAVLAAAIGAG